MPSFPTQLAAIFAALSVCTVFGFVGLLGLFLAVMLGRRTGLLGRDRRTRGGAWQPDPLDLGHIHHHGVAHRHGIGSHHGATAHGFTHRLGIGAMPEAGHHAHGAGGVGNHHHHHTGGHVDTGFTSSGGDFGGGGAGAHGHHH